MDELIVIQPVNSGFKIVIACFRQGSHSVRLWSAEGGRGGIQPVSKGFVEQADIFAYIQQRAQYAHKVSVCPIAPTHHLLERAHRQRNRGCCYH